MEVEAGVGEQVDLVVHVHVDRRVLVDCLQVRGAVETADVGTWERRIAQTLEYISTGAWSPVSV